MAATIRLAVQPSAPIATPNSATPSAWPMKNEKAWKAIAEARASGTTSVTWVWYELWIM